MRATPAATDRHRRSEWTALVVTVAARIVLTVLGSLLLWAVVPAAFGAHPTVVMTGSMLPRLVPGDVVFSRPVQPATLQLGQVLLYHDPDQPGHLRMHRWIATTADGRLVTKGDANPARDSTPIDRSAVVGVASMRVPFVARPVVWAADHRLVPLVAAGLGLVVALVAASWFRAEDDPETTDGDTDPAAGPGHPDHVDTATDTGDAEQHTRGWPRRLARSGAALLVVVGLGATFASTADAATAKFRRVDTSPTSQWGAADYFSCAGAARGDGSELTYPLAESSGTVADDVGPNNLDGTYTGGYTRSATGGPCGGRSVTLNGLTGQVTTPTAARLQAPDTFTWEIWFKTAANYVRGGKIIGLDTSQTGTAGQYDRHLYMTNTGQLVFGVYNGVNSTVDSGTTRYNDGKWHLADAQLSSAGMKLYVDGRLVDSDRTVTSGEDYLGWLRIGGGSLGGAWPSLPSSTFFGGSVAYASAYLTALSATDVAGHYAVGKP